MSEQNFDPSKHPHRRYNPLKDEWVLVSPQRNLRPWQGKVEQVVVEVKPKHSTVPIATCALEIVALMDCKIHNTAALGCLTMTFQHCS